MSGKNYVFVEDLSSQDIEADVASQRLRLKRSAGTTPLAAADTVLVRQGGNLTEVPASAVGSDFWRTTSGNLLPDGTDDPTEGIIHLGNVAVGQDFAARTKSLPTVAQLNATDTSNIRLTSAGTISGITGGADGKLLVLTNVTGGEVKLANNSPSAVSGTAIKIGDSFDFVMAPNASVMLNYDPVDLCWRTISQTVLGYAPQYLEVQNNASQTITVGANVIFQNQLGGSGDSISMPTASSFLLKAGRKYRVTGAVGIVTVATNGYVGFRWHDGTGFVGSLGLL